MASDPRPHDLPPRAAPRRMGAEWRLRADVTGRILLAAVGGYAVAALATAFGAIALPLPRAEAVSAATQASFAVMAAAVVFAFGASSLLRAALGLGGVAAVLAVGLWLAGGFSPTLPA